MKKAASRRLSSFSITQWLNDSMTQFSDSPEVVFLLRLFVMRCGIDGKRHPEGIRLRCHGKGLRQLWFECRGIYHRFVCRDDRLYQRSRGTRGLVRVADEFEQVMILDVLDLVGEADEAAVDIVERPTIELIAELFAPHTESVTAGVLAQHQFRVRHAYRLRRHDFVGQRIL